MSMKTINRAISTVNAVVKKSTKVFVSALPVATIGANVAIAVAGNPNDPSAMLRSIVRRYTGFDPYTGSFSWEYLGMGAGTLVGSTIVSQVLKAIV